MTFVMLGKVGEEKPYWQRWELSLHTSPTGATFLRYLHFTFPALEYLGNIRHITPLKNMRHVPMSRIFSGQRVLKHDS